MTTAKKTQSVQANLTGFTFLAVLIVAFYTCKFFIFDNFGIFTISPDGWFQYFNWLFMAYATVTVALSLRKITKTKSIKAKAINICFNGFKFFASYTLLTGNYNMLTCCIIYLVVIFVLSLVITTIMSEAMIFKKIYQKNRIQSI